MRHVPARWTTCRSGAVATTSAMSEQTGQRSTRPLVDLASAARAVTEPVHVTTLTEAPARDAYEIGDAMPITAGWRRDSWTLRAGECSPGAPPPSTMTSWFWPMATSVAWYGTARRRRPEEGGTDAGEARASASSTPRPGCRDRGGARTGGAALWATCASCSAPSACSGPRSPSSWPRARRSCWQSPASGR